MKLILKLDFVVVIVVKTVIMYNFHDNSIAKTVHCKRGTKLQTMFFFSGRQAN